MNSNHFNDEDGNPAGGITYGTGFTIAWQNGPLNVPGGKRNGAFVEEVIEAAIDRIEYYQDSKFACDENYLALKFLYSALSEVRRRTARRTKQGTEGTHAGN